MRNLNNYGLTECLQSLKQPTLGICLGMQLLFKDSEEGGTIPLLGVIPASIAKFDDRANRTVPHMGWNTVISDVGNPLTKGLPAEPYFYFVHSYYAPITPYTTAKTDYGQDFSSMVARDNFFGCQFHPERSGENGATLLKNFLEL